MARRSNWIHELNWDSKEDRDVREILQAWELARNAKANAEMVAAAAAQGERRFLKAPNGFGGEVGLMVHSASFHYWGQRLGYECWQDAQFVREYLRDNPTARVKNRAHETTVVVPASEALSPARPKFHKQYD